MKEIPQQAIDEHPRLYDYWKQCEGKTRDEVPELVWTAGQAFLYLCDVLSKHGNGKPQG